MLQIFWPLSSAFRKNPWIGTVKKNANYKVENCKSAETWVRCFMQRICQVHIFLFFFLSLNMKLSSLTPWWTSDHYSSLFISIHRLLTLFISVRCLSIIHQKSSSQSIIHGCSSTEHFSPVFNEYSFIYHHIHFLGNHICQYFDDYSSVLFMCSCTCLLHPLNPCGHDDHH